MRHTLRTLTAALTATLALTACEPEEDKNNDVRPRADMAAPDMTPDADLPDQGPDQDAPDQSAAGLRLVGVSAEGPRVHEASAPEELTLALAVEGEGDAPAEVTITFVAGGETRTQTAPYAAQLKVVPPALPAHRGPVEVAVRLGESEATLDGGLSYGAMPMFAAGALVSTLTGIERADEVWALPDEVILVRQRPTQGPAPTPGFLLEEAADTFAAFKLMDGRAVALGAPIKLDDVVLVERLEQADGTPLVVVGRRGAAGETIITALRVDGGGAKDDATPLATLLDTQDVQGVSMRGGVLFVLTTSVNAAGERVVELVNTATKKTYGSPLLDQLGAGLRLISQTKGSVEPDPTMTVIGWVKRGDVYELTVVDDVASEGGQIAGVLDTSATAPDERPIDLAMVADSGKRYLAYAFGTPEGTRLVVGELVRARTVMTVVPSITATLPGPHLDVFGAAEVEPPTARAIPPRIRVVRADYCNDGATYTSAGDKLCGTTDHFRAATNSSWIMTLPLHGDKTQVEAMPLQSGAVAAREPFKASITIRIVKSSSRTQIIEVAGDKLATYSHDARREEAVVDGRLVAGARHLIAGAVVPVGPERMHVGVVASAPTATDAADGGLTLGAARFGVVLALNNTKKEPAVPDIADIIEGEVLSYSGSVTPVYAQASEGLIFGVEGTRVRGTRRSGLLRMTGAALAALKDGEAPRVGVNAGLVFLPAGFVVDQLVAHEDEVYFLGVKGGERFKDGRYEGGLFRMTLPASGRGEVGAPEELLSAAKLRADSGDADAELTSLLLGDADPTTPLPGIIALTNTGGPRVFIKQIDKSSPLLSVAAPGGAVEVLDAVMFDERGAYMMGFEEGALDKPVRLTFTATGLNRNAAPLTRVAGVDLSSDYRLDLRGGSAIVVDLNGDGRSDALVTAPGPGTQGRGYHYLYLGTPGGGFTPILTPDAVIYGALRMTTGLASSAAALGDALASKLRR